MAKATFETDGDVGILTLTDPPLNLVGLEMVSDMEAALDAAGEAPIRALLLRAEGETFTGGAHVEEMFKDVPAAEAKARIERFAVMVERVEQLPVPTVAVVRGLCLAAGLELVMTIDQLWAGSGAQFSFAEPLIGLTPIAGGAYRLASRVGVTRALETIYTAGFYDAKTFHSWGAVNRVVEDGRVEEKALAFAHRLAAGPTKAYGVTRRLMRTYTREGFAAADALNPEICPPLFETEDMQHGVRSLLAHGPGQAKFAGR